MQSQRSGKIQYPTLLILAAGMASRYGSLKQMDNFGPNGESILDYSIYDALRAGFRKIVFVLNKSIEEDFKNIIAEKLTAKTDVDYVIQDLEILPHGFSVPDKRTKPWGTAHAVWTAAPKISEPFAVINGDDFYGYESFKSMADFLKNESGPNHFAMIGYPLKNTLSDHGAVSRAICEIDRKENLKALTEYTHITSKATGIVAKSPYNEDLVLRGDEIVSMNLTGFTPSVFPYFESCFKEFLLHQGAGSAKVEFFLPEVLNKFVKSGKGKVKVLPTSEKWFGVTFPEDKPVATQKLKQLIADNVYPEDLWEDNYKGF